MEAFIQYAAAKVATTAKQRALGNYIAEGIRFISENTAKYAGGPFLQTRFDDLVRSAESGQKDERTGDEIVRDVIKNAGIKIKVREEVKNNG